MPSPHHSPCWPLPVHPRAGRASISWHAHPAPTRAGTSSGREGHREGRPLKQKTRRNSRAESCNVCRPAQGGEAGGVAARCLLCTPAGCGIYSGKCTLRMLYIKSVRPHHFGKPRNPAVPGGCRFGRCRSRSSVPGTEYIGGFSLVAHLPQSLDGRVTSASHLPGVLNPSWCVCRYGFSHIACRCAVRPHCEGGRRRGNGMRSVGRHESHQAWTSAPLRGPGYRVFRDSLIE